MFKRLRKIRTLRTCFYQGNETILSTFLLVGGRIEGRKEEYIMTVTVSKILNQIKKELEGIKNELKKPNALKDKKYKEWLTMKKKWEKTHSK